VSEGREGWSVRERRPATSCTQKAAGPCLNPLRASPAGGLQGGISSRRVEQRAEHHNTNIYPGKCAENEAKPKHHSPQLLDNGTDQIRTKSRKCAASNGACSEPVDNSSLSRLTFPKKFHQVNLIGAADITA
jgi:hypothetical protein